MTPPCVGFLHFSMIKIISLWRQFTVSGRLGSSVCRVLTSVLILISIRKIFLKRNLLLARAGSLIFSGFTPECWNLCFYGQIMIVQHMGLGLGMGMGMGNGESEMKGKVRGWHSRLYVRANLGGGTAYSQLYAVALRIILLSPRTRGIGLAYLDTVYIIPQLCDGQKEKEGVSKSFSRFQDFDTLSTMQSGIT